MRIFNTMSRTREELVPLHENKVGIYACGPTVYSFIHIGNARPLIVYDTLYRYLKYTGYDVTMVMNFTDIDDKVIRRANEEGVTYDVIAERYINEFYHDADALNITREIVNPRATEHMDEIIALVKTLIERGHAYPVPSGDVYFSVRSYPAYGKLSKQDLEDLESGARVESSDEKRDPLDFALWKAAKPGEPSWTSPWGEGRPGWHIECSAMSMNILGQTFDIHAGGADLIFPHHENEIAQSEAATGVPFAKYWMHNGHINVNNKKMSKSAGNFFNIRDIIEKFPPEAVRLFMLSSQYRTPINFSEDLMEQSASALERLYTARERLEEAQVGEKTEQDDEFVGTLDGYRKSFREAMDDDLNTADAIGVLFDFARQSNTFVSAPRSREAIDAAKSLFDELCSVLGILQKKRGDDIPEEALKLLEQRNEARRNKDYKTADELRDKLTEMGFVVEDSREGAKLKRIRA